MYVLLIEIENKYAVHIWSQLMLLLELTNRE